MKRRLLALLLVLAMVLSMAPMGVLAEDESDEEPHYDSFIAGTARLTDGGLDGIEVVVTGCVAEKDLRSFGEVTVVAATYVNGQMVDSASKTTELLDGSESPGIHDVLHLYNTDVDAQIALFLLWPDLQPVPDAWSSAKWEHYDSGTEDNSFYTIDWTFSNGALSLLTFDSAPLDNISHEWDKYLWEITSVSTTMITSIGEDFFRGYQNLEAVDLGYGLGTIGRNAFRGLKNLKTVILPDTLTRVDDSAFADLSDDVEIILPDTFPCDSIHVEPVGNEVLLEAIAQLQASQSTVDDTAANDTVDETVPEATEETVPETTEETVPETTEETVPETTEETVPDTTPDTITPEEAAEEDYYIAPEGAELQEEGTLEEMAAYSGTDKVSKGTHTATFTGLVPLQLYTFISSKAPGSLNSDDLQYISIAFADAEGTVKVTYIPKTTDAAIAQLYGPEELTLTADRDYVSLHPGETIDLQFTASDDVTMDCPWNGDEPDLILRAEKVDGSETHWKITTKEDYAPEETESFYVEFSATDRLYQMATVRVRVDIVPESTTVTNATLGETKLTRNIYDSEATQIPVFLDLSYPAAEVDESEANGIAAFSAQETTVGRLIQNVTFSDATDAAAKDLFQVTAQDDHTLLLNTAEGVDLTDAAVVKAIKSSYKMGFHLEFADGKAVDTGVLTLTVQKKLPTVKAAAVTLNPYYQTSAQVSFTGGEIASLVSVPSVDGLKLVETESGITAVMTAVPAKAATKNLTAEVYVEGYNVPVKVTVPVKLDPKAPALKLGQTSWTVSSLGKQELEIPIQCTTKGVSMEDLDIFDITVLQSNGQESPYYRAYTWGGTLYLSAVDQLNDDGISLPRPAGKENLTLRLTAFFQDETEDFGAVQSLPMDLKMTVNSVDPVIKLDKSQVTLNIFVGEQAFTTPIKTIPSGSMWPDEWPDDYDKHPYYYYTVIEGKAYGNAEDFLSINLDVPGKIGIDFNREAFYDTVPTEAEQAKAINDTYTLYIALADNGNYKNWTKVNIRLSDGVPKMTAKVSGSIDLISDLNYVTITPSFQNANGTTEYDPWGSVGLGLTVRNSDGEDRTEQFMIDDYTESGKLRLTVNPTNRPDPDKYTATVTMPGWLGTGSATVTFNVTNKAKPTVKVTGKMDSLMMSKSAVISTNYYRMDAWGLQVSPDVALYTTGKTPALVSDELYNWNPDFDGNIVLFAAPGTDTPLAAGKYTAKLTYPDGTVLSAPITVTQSPVTLKLSKASTTIHPGFTDNSAEIKVSMTNANAYAGYSAVEYYQSNGKTQWDDQNLVTVDLGLFPEEGSGYVWVTPTGVEPAKDTTVKVKLIPDTRIPSKFTWLTVKVLGGKNLKQTVTLKAGKAIDPSYSDMSTSMTYTIKGFDNQPEGFDSQSKEGDVQLEVYNPKTKQYEEADCDIAYYSVFDGDAYLAVNDRWEEDEFIPTLDTSRKYQARVSFGHGVEGTVAVKVAYSSNKFTVAKAPTLYKQDAYEPMDIHLNAKSIAQQISYVTIKGNTNFGIYGGGSDYTLYLKDGTGTAKLKTTTLTLQIFLKGNTTTKPNATTTVKVTVK